VKCQRCEKPATFHITELTGGTGPQVVHLCEEHARDYLSQEATGPGAAIAGNLSKQLKLGQTAEELEQLDRKACPVCGITFYEFRNGGRLGCPYDYTVFEEDLEPLLFNIHGGRQHRGKRPQRLGPTSDVQAEIMQLRRQMQEAIHREQYERASEIRDRIRSLERSGTAAPSLEKSEGP
jgi:protein arginine kinase activator